MVQLRDYFTSDLDVFLNLNEFAEIHNLDGNDVAMIIDEGGHNDIPRNPIDLYNNANGIYVTTKTLYIKGSDYDQPVVDEPIVLDQKRYYVQSSVEENGILKIVITANQA